MLSKISIIVLIWISLSAALSVEKSSIEENQSVGESKKVEVKSNTKFKQQNDLSFWVEPAIGGSNVGFGVGVGVVMKHKIDYIISTTAHTEIEWGFGAEPDEIVEYNFLLGKNKQIGWGYLFARAGVGYVNGRIKKNFDNKEACQSVIILSLILREDCVYDMEKISSLGVPLEAGIIWGKYLGGGIKLHANISQEPVIGFKVVTALGKFNDW